MPAHPSRPHRPPRRRDGGDPASSAARDHEPAPVDISSESVAGEEDPGASAEPPTANAPATPDPGASGDRSKP